MIPSQVLHGNTAGPTRLLIAESTGLEEGPYKSSLTKQVHAHANLLISD